MSFHALRLRTLRGAAAALLPLLAACASSKTAPPPAEPTPALGFDAPGLAPGARVVVERGGQWLAATVVSRIAGDRVLVHYEGYGSEWDEAVGLDRARPAPGLGAPVQLQIGEKVLVTVQGRQLLADVVAQVGPDEWRVHYDGYGPEVAENVRPDRLRRPFAGATPHPPGEAALVDVGGRPMPARVLVPLAADRWLVRFDGFGPEYDQEVTADRFRVAPSPATAPAAPAPSAGTPAPSAGTPPAAAPTPSAAGSAFQPNEEVLVAHRGVYHPALVVAPSEGGRLRVRYSSSAVGYEQGLHNSDEEVAPARVTRALAPEKGGQYRLDQRIFVEWHGLYFPGKVTKVVEKGLYRVRFDGFGPEADEVVPARRLRPRP